MTAVSDQPCWQTRVTYSCFQRTQGVTESFAKASQAARDATGQLKERTSKVSKALAPFHS